MSYPQPPHQPPAPWPGAGPGFPKPPTKGTTVGAAVLALISGVVTAGFLVLGLIEASGYLDLLFKYMAFLISFVAGWLSTLLLILGGIMLFARSGAGRFMVVGGAVIKLGLMAWSLTGPIGPVIQSFIGMLLTTLALVAMVLALVPATGAWIAAKKQPPHGFIPHQGPPPPGFPPQGPPPGYGPPQGPPPPGYGPPPGQGFPPPGPPPPGYGQPPRG